MSPLAAARGALLNWFVRSKVGGGLMRLNTGRALTSQIFSCRHVKFILIKKEKKSKEGNRPQNVDVYSWNILS